MSESWHARLERCRSLADTGRYREASDLADQLVSSAEPTTRLEVLTMQAQLRKAEGRYEAAIQSLERCNEIAIRTGDTAAQASALLETGRLYLLLRRVGRAFQAWGNARGLPLSPQLKVAFLAALSDGFAQAGEFAKAEQLADEAIIAMETEIPEDQTIGAGYLRLMAERRLAAAGLAERRGQYHRVLYALQGIENNSRIASLDREGAPDHVLEVSRQADSILPMLDLMRGRALLGLSESEAAREPLLRARQTALLRGDASIAVHAAASLGHVEQQQGRRHEAFVLLSQAVEEAEEWLMGFELEEFRSALRTRLGDVYTALVIAAMNDGNPQVAWQTVERARAREFLAAIESTGAGNLARESDFDRLEELNRRIGTLSARLLEIVPESPSFGKLREAHKSLIDEKVRHLEEMRRVPRRLALVQPLEKSWDRIAALMGDDTAFVEFFFGPSQLLVQVVVDGHLRTRSIDIHPTAVGRRVRRLLRELTVDPSRRAQDSWYMLARQLYDGIWAPLVEVLREKPRVCVVPHGPLLDLPFAVLCPPGEPPLLASTEIVYAPSASILAAVADQRVVGANKLAVFADPLPDGPWGLAGARAEAEAIKRARPDAEVRFGSESTPAAVLEAGRTADVLHVACHAEFDDKHPILSALLLASEAGEVARLEAHAIYGAELKARLVVLSACQTARVDRDPGTELQGLVRAFIVSGAGAVIGSQWEVDDIATARLMIALYESLGASAPPGAALRAAQLGLASSAAYADPYYWAAFGLHGDWR